MTMPNLSAYFKRPAPMVPTGRVRSEKKQVLLAFSSQYIRLASGVWNCRYGMIAGMKKAIAIDMEAGAIR